MKEQVLHFLNFEKWRITKRDKSKHVLRCLEIERAVSTYSAEREKVVKNSNRIKSRS
jgi:hypothetical protein